MIHETPIQRDLRSLARMLAEEKRRIPRPTEPPQWVVEDCKRLSDVAHRDAVEAKAHFEHVNRTFLQRCAEVGGDQAHRELDEAKADLDGAREFLARCWDFAEHGLTDSWEELESGVFDCWLDQRNNELAEPDDQPGSQAQEQQRPWKTEAKTALETACQGTLF